MSVLVSARLKVLPMNVQGEPETTLKAGKPVQVSASVQRALKTHTTPPKA
jgi:hypothetical protein